MKSSLKVLGFLAGAALFAVGMSGCSGKPKEGAEAGGSSGSAAPASTSIDAKGSTFVKPFLENVFEEFKGKSGVTINYQGGGSGAGISGLLDGTVPFAASDAPMSDEEMGKATSGPSGAVMNLPIVLGAIAIAYNLDGVADLKLDAEVLAHIFQRKITNWNDPKIAALNAGVTLPDLPITVVVRADGSGSTYVFSDFLSKAAPAAWTLGTDKQISWPNDVQKQQKSDGVSKATKDTPGAITYVELSFAKQAGLGLTSVKNADGQFVKPEPAGVTAAAENAALPEDFRGSIVNAPGATSYPVSSYVFALVPSDLSKNTAGKGIVDALKYVVGEGQAKAEGLDYAPLPETIKTKVSEKLAAIKVAS